MTSKIRDALSGIATKMSQGVDYLGIKNKLDKLSHVEDLESFRQGYEAIQADLSQMQKKGECALYTELTKALLTVKTEYVARKARSLSLETEELIVSSSKQLSPLGNDISRLDGIDASQEPTTFSPIIEKAVKRLNARHYRETLEGLRNKYENLQDRIATLSEIDPTKTEELTLQANALEAIIIKFEDQYRKTSYISSKLAPYFIYKKELDDLEGQLDDLQRKSEKVRANAKLSTLFELRKELSTLVKQAEILLNQGDGLSHKSKLKERAITIFRLALTERKEIQQLIPAKPTAQELAAASEKEPDMQISPPPSPIASPLHTPPGSPESIEAPLSPPPSFEPVAHEEFGQLGKDLIAAQKEMAEFLKTNPLPKRKKTAAIETQKQAAAAPVVVETLKPIVTEKQEEDFVIVSAKDQETEPLLPQKSRFSLWAIIAAIGSFFAGIASSIASVFQRAPVVEEMPIR